MIVKNEEWKAIPLLHVYDESMDNETPVVIFLHGFLSAKEHNLHYAYQLVEKGVRVILPDALLHGERTTHLTENEMNLNFWKIVLKSVEEVNTIYQELKFKQLLRRDNIGIAGTSMGGIVTSGCLAIYPWIKTAGICMGTTSFTKLAQHQVDEFKAKGIEFPMSNAQQEATFKMLSHYNLEQRMEHVKQSPIIFWHGQKDSVVPYRMSREFYDQLNEKQEQYPIHYITEPNAGHAVSRNGILMVTKWLAQHLA
ncbi:esterase [Solibacillus sp. R5-41]|uniref:alpha/beta fold hydrolase n=1 Tax=Solibacillus sp. R5-41 TaxID=2048654 RepID=UPI000C1296B8|nr:alpha/beta fold hydrolase [Solibacillus sp. R5-41]ATP39113.1 esterase [Solibacillus sp. R5-41]